MAEALLPANCHNVFYLNKIFIRMFIESAYAVYAF